MNDNRNAGSADWSDEVPMSGIRRAARRLLSVRVSVGDIIETVMWLMIPYMIVGLVWAFFHVEEVWHMEDVLRSRLPAGGAVAAYPLVAALWPAYLIAGL